MKFGPVPLAEAAGAVLAHSLALPGRALRKGRILGDDDVAALGEAGYESVVAARLESDDLGEDAAAAAVAGGLAGEGLILAPPSTGRANIFSGVDGVLRVDAAAIAAVNAIDEAVTVATLPDYARIARGQMVATVKIIPFGAPRAVVEAVRTALTGGRVLKAHPFRLSSAALILTSTPGMRARLLDKGSEALRTRLASMGAVHVAERRVAHEPEAVARAIAADDVDLTLILGASATSDRRDVGPAAVVAAGGRVTRLGMPVDPGNLLFIGEVGRRVVIGLPGSARSLRLSGVDWVIERVACGIRVGSAEVAAMGVGGLLKEIPSRPEPRAGGARAPRKPVVMGALLAAGASRRMGGRNKLLEMIGDEPLLRRAARALLASRVDEAIVILPPGSPALHAALEGLSVRVVENRVAAEGMASSIRAAIAAAPPGVDAVILALADMPEVGPAHLDALIDAFDPGSDRAICRAVAEDGAPGHPVLFGRRFFEALTHLEGDQGARSIIAENAGFLVEVPTPGMGASVDLDTPEAWDKWRRGLPKA